MSAEASGARRPGRLAKGIERSYPLTVETNLTEPKSQGERIDRTIITLESAHGDRAICVGIHSLKHLSLTRRADESY